MVADYLPQLKAELERNKIKVNEKPTRSYPKALSTGIPGRKVAQIEALAERVCESSNSDSWLEWCSGKGYLGRFLNASSRKPVTSLEYQKSLCDSGQQEAIRLGLAMHFVHGDALDPKLPLVFSPKMHAVALHACGDLHVELIKQAAKHKLSAVSIAPCCYHLTKDDVYQGLSEVGKRSSLNLTRNELRIPLQKTVTGGQRVSKHRYQEMSYRLGFDALLRGVLGFDEYTPVPSIKKSQLGQGFMAFCHWASNAKGIELAEVDLTDTDFEHFQALGESRYWQMERLSLVQSAFHRLIEIWLVLDRACFLEEQDYQVELSEFCTAQTTPRNLLIHAIKK